MLLNLVPQTQTHSTLDTSKRLHFFKTLDTTVTIQDKEKMQGKYRRVRCWNIVQEKYPRNNFITAILSRKKIYTI
uniref:Uncharacterized protein n=1 Tax=Anguilla anguilla TaxID=7936 RepID=A0A0E9WVV2_ANGAN